MYRQLFALAAAFSLALLGCADTELTAPDLASIDDNRVSKKGGKPGGPGGEEPTPAGVVYAQMVGGDQVEMDADGTMLRTLDPLVQGDPTRNTHGGERWFAYVDNVAGIYPDSAGRTELFAISESGNLVQLTSDALFQPMGQASPRWSPTPADAQIAFLGRRFSSQTATADEGGIYVANVVFDGNAPAISGITLRIAAAMLAEPPENPDAPPCSPSVICYAEPNVEEVEWSPDGTGLIYSKVDLPQSPSGLETRSSIYLYHDGSSTLVASPGGTPRSSNEGVVLFRDNTLTNKGFTNRLWKVNLDGSGLTQMEEISDNIKGANTNNHSFARFNGHGWSPDGAHFAYVIRECQFGGAWCNIRLVRRKADGSGETTVPDVYRLHGWR